MSQYNVDGFFPCCGNPEEKLPGYWNLRGRFPGANYASLWSLFKWTDPMPFLQNVGWLVSSCDAEDTMKPFLCGFANNEWLPKESSRRFRHAKIGGSLKDKEGCSCVVEFSKDTSLEAKLVEVVNPGVSGATPYSFVLITIKKPYCTPKEGAKKIVQVEDRGATLYAYRFGDLSPEGARSDDCYIQLVYEAVYQQYSGGEEGILSMITALIANTTPKGSKSNDPFWEKAETALVQALCFYIRAEFPVQEQNFSSVMYLLRQADAPEGKKSTLDIMFERFEETHPNHIAAKSYAVYRSAGGGKTAQSIVISAQTRLQAFNLAAMKRITDEDTIDLKSIGQRKTALFCVTPVGDTTFNFLVGMLYTQLFHTLYHYAETECQGKRLPVPVRFLLDEFANIGLIPNFNQLLATMRKYEISCTIVLQALSQLKALYRDDWEVIIANCDSLLFLGATDKTTLEYISAILGKQTIRSVNSSRSFGKQKGYTTNYNKTGRELATTTELRTMKNSSCVYFLRGLDPFFSTKFDPQSHPNYMKTGMGDDAKRYIVSDHKNNGGDL